MFLTMWLTKQWLADFHSMGKKNLMTLETRNCSTKYHLLCSEQSSYRFNATRVIKQWLLYRLPIKARINIVMFEYDGYIFKGQRWSPVLDVQHKQHLLWKTMRFSHMTVSHNVLGCLYLYKHKHWTLPLFCCTAFITFIRLMWPLY